MNFWSERTSALLKPRAGALWSAAVALLLSTNSLQAGIDDTDDSALLIATYIAADTGGDPSSYMNYARSLAKVLSQLSPAQQENVFGPAVYAELSAGGGGTGGGETGGGGSGGTKTKGKGGGTKTKTKGGGTKTKTKGKGKG